MTTPQDINSQAITRLNARVEELAKEEFKLETRVQELEYWKKSVDDTLSKLNAGIPRGTR